MWLLLWLKFCFIKTQGKLSTESSGCTGWHFQSSVPGSPWVRFKKASNKGLTPLCPPIPLQSVFNSHTPGQEDNCDNSWGKPEVGVLQYQGQQQGKRKAHKGMKAQCTRLYLNKPKQSWLNNALLPSLWLLMVIEKGIKEHAPDAIILVPWN